MDLISRQAANEILKPLIGILLWLILVMLLAVAITKCQKDEDEAKYKGGRCECGGNYVYQQAIARNYDTDYIYICDKCGSMIELETYRAEREEE